MLSMTGYGEAIAEESGDFVKVELTSVNRRHMKVKFNINRPLIEKKVEDLIRQVISRGTIHLHCESNILQQNKEFPVVNEEILEKYDKIITKISSDNKLIEGKVSPTEMLNLPGVVSFYSARNDGDKAEQLLLKAVRGALDGLVESRRKEGASIAEDLKKSLQHIARQVDTIQQRVPKTLDRYRKNLLKSVEKILQLTGEEKQARLEKELKNYAEKCDISEEISRIKSHLNQFYGFFDKAGAVGRNLEFLIQEIQREVNTVGAKANDATISQLSVNIKTELEKCREQVKNLE